MSVFKEHKTHADRSASDRRRHREKIDKAIREGITDIVSTESIIGQNGKKKVRIPVKGIKQYRFVYGGGNGSKRVGSSGDSDVKRGQKIKKKQKGQTQAPGNKAGEEVGEEYYEVEITLDELANYLFEDLSLPDLAKKQLKQTSTKKMKRSGYRNNGIRPRLDKKESVKKMLKRKNIARRTNPDFDENDFPFRETDLRYRHIKNKEEPNTSAAIFFIMDISGSMGKEKKFLARSFFFLLYQFIRSKYEKTEIVFIAHDARAYEVNEEQFFSRGSSGGTIVSAALEMTEEIINKRYHPNSWNIYAFQCSDGDNWSTDNSNVVKFLERLVQKCQFIGYCEIEPADERLKWAKPSDEGLMQIYKDFEATNKNVKQAFVDGKDKIWPAFKKFFGNKI